MCHSDLHTARGEWPGTLYPCVPGHEIVGTVTAIGKDVKKFRVGDRVGVGCLVGSCGHCSACDEGLENYCENGFVGTYNGPASAAEGGHTFGGYSTHIVVDEGFVLAIRHKGDLAAVAPLLCAGIIGYRALRRAEVPAGGVLGIYGFGGSAHLTAQIAMAAGTTVHVMTRDASARDLALDLGAASAQGAADRPPEPLDAAILFAHVGDLVLPAMEALAPGGTLAIAGIHLSDIPPLDYERHLFHERQIRSVTANTRTDGEAFLAAAARIPVHPTVTPMRLEDGLTALQDLDAGRVDGAAVLHVSG